MNKWLWLVIALVLIAVGIYWYIALRPKPAGLANPASVHCEQTLGGTLEIVNTSAGQVGYCHLQNGSVCEEWDLYRSGTCTPPAAANYKDATYLINGASTTLVNGVATQPTAPESASMLITRYFGNEAAGDLNGDGTSDVAFLLTQDGGGSGIFYYVAVAFATSTGYVGTNAILLGDRIAPQTTEIRDGILIVNYAERAAGEAMTEKPSLGASLYATYQDGQLTEIAPLGKGEMVLWGNAVMGHEVRTFTPCGKKENELWVLGDSPAHAKLLQTYQDWVATQDNPYKPLFVILAGRITDAPSDGFGADYEQGFSATQLIKIAPLGTCK
jgi:putative hemolysin